jgi:hypothetical protein
METTGETDNDSFITALLGFLFLYYYAFPILFLELSTITAFGKEYTL